MSAISQQQVRYSIHCLSAGSESTEPSFLLQVERGSTFTQRYAFGGIECRLAVDQKLPLHPVRACFLNNSQLLSGLPGLLLTLSQAGVEQVTVVASSQKLHEKVDKLSNLILGPHRRYPSVQCCGFPANGQWFQVYQDDFIMVYASTAKHIDDTANQTSWLVTLLQSSQKQSTFAVLSQGVSSNIRKSMPIAPSCVISLKKTHQSGTNVERSLQIFDVVPTTESLVDPELFMRSLHQAQALARVLPFLIRLAESATRNDDCFTTCAALVLDGDGSWRLNNDQRLLIEGKCDDHVEPSSVLPDVPQLECIWTVDPSVRDDNEIELDDDDDDDDEQEVSSFRSIPHLLILGTGCATPSAYRASSGHALFLPSAKMPQLVGLLDCGEGTLSQLHRHLPSFCGSLCDQLKYCKWIWISHAHLDHYGGLPQLLEAITRAKCNARNRGDTRDSKRQRLIHDDTVVLIAPRKVFDFLNILGLRNDYRGVTHNEFMISQSMHIQKLRDCIFTSGGIDTLINIPVHHCRDAHAVVLGLPGGFSLCFSGDTRPCPLLSQETVGVNLLLHEATFLDSDREEAIQKKHSTVSEALQVARNAKMVLLTHFSNRNPRHIAENAAAMAVDGMWIPLVDDAMQKLPQLSRVIQQVLTVAEKED